LQRLAAIQRLKISLQQGLEVSMSRCGARWFIGFVSLAFTRFIPRAAGHYLLLLDRPISARKNSGLMERQHQTR
ncbi:MAG: hypothetical protein L0Y43_00395, partial [Methylococcaceae bacterium]|nr:hypothetical protein [Methylococcaceae bacterium]